MVHALSEPGVARLIDVLREATRPLPLRIATSEAMSRLCASDYGLDEYRMHLGRLLGFFESLDDALSVLLDDALSVLRKGDGMSVDRRRSVDLREDLRLMGQSAPEIAAQERCGALPVVDATSLAACDYVMPGSMLGGKVIARHLRKQLGDDTSLCFYGDEDGRHEAMWEKFCRELEEIEDPDRQAICSTALGTFRAFSAWMTGQAMRGGRE